MGERNFVLRYQMSRHYADEQAERLERGEPIRGWTHVHDWKEGKPEPPRITLVGPVWVAHCYDIAQDDAERLASRDRFWLHSVEACRDKADSYRKRTQEGEK